MHHGVVGEYLEPGVTLIVLGANRGTVPVDFIIDTGCTEEVILPQDLIDRLNLIRVDDITLALADGTHAYPLCYCERSVAISSP